ncbi:MAG TPA: DNA mismatch repair endonuclease MutL [Longimicrobiales bacterium]|nr:DNA mismatch repair endonuclease MutL [Longimicrobiales bacterium]
MPRRIQVLPDALANQIAAGEVVERPASVVKELIENALDAAATRIDIEIRNGGKTEIRVADDGHGMSRDDALLCFDRHATSKIRVPDDLRIVRTLGFRGEALPSIASVSRTTLETAEQGGVGTRVRVSAGRVLGVEDCARQVGTTVVVRNLFVNVPARAKFLRSAAVETRAIVDVVQAHALAHLSTAFRLESNGRALLELPAAPDLASRAGALWGDDVAARFLALRHVHEGVSAAGLVERPDAAPTGPRRVHLYIEGRPFRDRELVRAVERAYRTTVPHGTRPSVLLYIGVRAGDVDVNVHPSKAEVRFRERWRVEAAIEQAVRSALAGIESAATLDTRPGLPRMPQLERQSGDEPAAPPIGQLAFFVPAAPGDPDTERADAEAAPGGARTESRARLWQVHDMYIIAETRSGMLIIDQHSAHERVLFEQIMAGFGNGATTSQRLLFPITLRLTPSEYDVVDSLRALFEGVGFEIEPFGGRTVIVHSAPNPHPYFDPQRCLRDMVGELATGSELTRAAHNQHERIAMTFACKGAIKAGQKLSQQEMDELFGLLFDTELPYHDVHGRPTVIRLSLEEMERRFGRHG